MLSRALTRSQGFGRRFTLVAASSVRGTPAAPAAACRRRPSSSASASAPRFFASEATKAPFSQVSGSLVEQPALYPTSEPTDLGNSVAVAAEVPMDQLGRRVRIFAPAQNTMMTGEAFTGFWTIQFIDRGANWNNPLMGWSSTRDPMASLATQKHLSFENKEQAIRFAEKNKWVYTVIEKHVKKSVSTSRKVKNYADNYKWKGHPTDPDEGLEFEEDDVVPVQAAPAGKKKAKAAAGSKK